ncbi:DUF502 domain-containing protein [Ferrovum myxofaciens]|uniref:DUF502 domain-containing protein n=1 Tax=Ferrovum myxofaciens TaxID=416213 RepID=A0A8F3IJK3_9PROT|nr:DUF502 domain-containing protein [Ferrovum myxofaciens]KXW59130.1 hypothetical protein FEMY_03560 [Ferrovum myxofaciens]MBU6995086.1 DUF502 domain-containing protein [Ferrovum myxofaciens]QKE38879.1 MAG: DUF502 domain-containing protein [Ferrovum myxofaciens]QWY74086.1 MAG: DUF502 domain-containing protein [Ferrovum myxofaciens]QWY76838.1 MAG: DUF502 domain-containing protein [Ferrovum myxofaciens]
MKRYFITGIVVLIPVVITLWVLRVIVTTLDQTLFLLPPNLRPETLFGMNVPGLGVLLTLCIVLLTGVVAANFLGQRLLTLVERLLDKIPVVNSIYSSVKQVSDTLFSSSGQAFRQVLLIRYPHADCWTLAFQTGIPQGLVATHLGEPHLNVYVPTTPNPTSGFFLMVPCREVIELDISVDDALKHIISMGVVEPRQKHPPKKI